MANPSGNPAGALRDVQAQLADLVQAVTELAQSSIGAAAGALSLNGALGGLTRALSQSGVASAFAFNELNKFTSTISSTVGRFVEAFAPVHVQRFQLAVKDLNATIGQILVGPLERFRVIVRELGGAIVSLEPSTRKMVMALAAASVGAVVMGGAVTLLSVALNSATAGLPAILGAVAGGVTALAGGMGLLSGTMQQFQGVVRQFMTTFRNVLDAMGQAFQTVFTAVQPLFGELAKLAKEMAGPITEHIRQMASNAAEFFAGLVPIVTAILPTLSQLGTALLQINSSLLQVAMAAVRPLLAGLAALVPVAQVLLIPLTQGLQMLGTLAGVFTGILTPALDLLLTPLRLVGEFAAAVAKELQGAFGELQSAFREVAALAADIGRGLAAAFKELVTAMRPLFDALKGPFLGVLHAITGAVRGVATAIQFMVDGLRDLLGLPAVGDRPLGSSAGKAFVSTRQDSTVGYLDKLQQSALSVGGGQDPAKETATHTGAIKLKMQELITAVENIPPRLAGLMLKQGASAAGGVASAAGGAHWQASRDLMARVLGH